MSDIAERLRDACVIDRHYGKSVTLTLDYDDYMEAADTITALRAENERLRDEATRIALEAQKVCLQNIQMKFALGYPMDANLEKYVLPENPFKCGACAALRAALSTARADALEEAAKVADAVITRDECVAAAIRALKEEK